MQPGVLRALEFDRIVETVRSFALTPMGDERLAAAGAVHRSADRWRSCWPRRPKRTKYLAAQQPVPAARVGRAAADSRRAGRRRTRARTAAAAGAGRRFSIRWTRPRGDPPRAGVVSARSKRQPAAPRRSRREIAQVREKIDPSGDVVDDASPELKHIRDRLRKQRTRLRGTLESYLRGKETAKYLQDQVVTERNGRYVLVVKAEHRSVDSRASCTARRRAARACFSSR